MTNAPRIAAGLVGLWLVCLLAGTSARGATINAASSSLADIQTAVNSTSTGDTVICPPGTTSITPSALLGIWRGITLQGAGTNLSIINVTRTDQAIYVQPGIGDNRLRITGFTFNALDSTETVIAVNGSANSVRVDNCFFNVANRAVTFNFYPSSGPAVGVIDSCSFKNINHPIYPYDRRNSDGFLGSVAWGEWTAANDGIGYVGTTNIVYVENNHFIWDKATATRPLYQGAVYGQAGGKLVFRYNKCNGLSPYMDAHGDGIGSSVYGTTYYEIYGNTFAEGNEIQAQGTIIYMRGGTYLCFSNVFTGVSLPLRMTVYFESDIHRITNSYYWANTWNGSTVQSSQVAVTDSGQTSAGYSAANIQLNTHYRLAAPQSGQKYYPYTPLSYPHPLASATPNASLAMEFNSYSVNEDAGPLTVKVVRTVNTSGAVSVNYATSPGTAANTVNYSHVSGTLNFADGETEKTVNIPIIDDGVDTSDLTLTFTLSGPSAGAVVGAPNSSLITILDTDAPALPPLMDGLTFKLHLGQITAPGQTNASGYFYQSTDTDDPANAGCSTVRVTIPETGDYRVDITVNAPDTSRNSAFVNFDDPPTAPTMVWHVTPLTSGLESRVVAWLGNGTSSSQFPTNLWNLSAGVHEFTYCGREANMFADEVTISLVEEPDPQSLSWLFLYAAALENAGNISFTVTRQGSPTGEVSVDYYTENDTALAGTHYTATNGTLIFAEGVTSTNVIVPILDNETYGGDVSFSLVLTNATGASILGSAVATATITDNEIEQSVLWLSGVFTTNENIGTLPFTVRRLNPSGTSTVNYQTLNGNALAGQDYAQTSGTLTFTGMQDSAGFSVTLFPNPTFTGPKYFLVRLSSPSNANIIGTADTLGVIIDDQQPPPGRVILRQGIFRNVTFR